MLQVTLILQTVDGRHNKISENQQRRNPIPYIPPIYQFCVDALLSQLMLQVIFCAAWEKWRHKWKAADVQRRKPFAHLPPYHQLIAQYNKYFLIVGNLILTSNQMDVIDRTFCIKLAELFYSFFYRIFQIFRHNDWFVQNESECILFQNCLHDQLFKPPYSTVWCSD